jgi:hypothetical protein
MTDPVHCAPNRNLPGRHLDRAYRRHNQLRNVKSQSVNGNHIKTFQLITSFRKMALAPPSGPARCPGIAPKEAPYHGRGTTVRRVPAAAPGR